MECPHVQQRQLGLPSDQERPRHEQHDANGGDQAVRLNQAHRGDAAANDDQEDGRPPTNVVSLSLHPLTDPWLRPVEQLCATDGSKKGEREQKSDTIVQTFYDDSGKKTQLRAYYRSDVVCAS